MKRKVIFTYINDNIVSASDIRWNDLGKYDLKKILSHLTKSQKYKMKSLLTEDIVLLIDENILIKSLKGWCNKLK